MNTNVFIDVTGGEPVTIQGTVIIECDYFKNRDVVTGSVEGCEWVSFLVLTVEFTNQARGVNVEEVDDDLGILAPV